MTDDLQHQPPQEGPKKLAEITLDEIKDAALVYAVQFGLQAQRNDCHVQAVPNRILAQEIGGGIDMRLPITKWFVTISPKGRPVRKGFVTVEYLSGGVCAMDFRDI